MKPRLFIAPLSDLLDADLRFAADIYHAKLGEYLSVEVLSEHLDVNKFPSRQTSYGKQIYADAVIKAGLNLRGEAKSIILLTSSDIFTSGTNYVFGLAVPGCAVVSKARIDPAFWRGFDEVYKYTKLGRSFFEKQYAKVLIHELGHTIGLTHCTDRNCVMRYSNSPIELYTKGEQFCSSCQSTFRILMSLPALNV
ncbi:MAG: matrixin family metalloprotease [Nitrososphaerales archaeon]